MCECQCVGVGEWNSSVRGWESVSGDKGLGRSQPTSAW